MGKLGRGARRRRQGTTADDARRKRRAVVKRPDPRGAETISPLLFVRTSRTRVKLRSTGLKLVKHVKRPVPGPNPASDCGRATNQRK